MKLAVLPPLQYKETTPPKGRGNKSEELIMKTCVFLFLFFLMPGLVMSAVIQEDVDYKGWKCLVMKNDTTEVIVAPQLAGRIIQYRVDGNDWLWVNESLAGKVFPPEENANMDIWKNYGGDKIWPAPQGWDGTNETWPGPGDPVLTIPHEYEIVKGKGSEVTLRMTGSDEDKGGHAGVRFIRELTLRDGSNRLEMKITMENVSDRAVSWAIWEVAQMQWTDKGGKKGDHDWNEDAYLAIPMNPKSKWPEKYQVMFGLASSFNWQPDYERNLMIVRYENFVGKLVMDVSDGWAAMVDPQTGYTFVQRFPYDKKAEYADKGNFELWVAGKGEFVHKNERRYAEDDPAVRFVEMEPQGPKVKLKPGKTTSIEFSWQVYEGGLDSVPEMNKRK